MALEQLTRTVDFVQDATPSATDANDGETYLDTSLTPPRLKIFDASAGSFIEPRSVQNLDQTVSSAASLTRISASYDLQTAKLVQKQNLLGASDIEINAFGTRALELSGRLLIANKIGSDNQSTKARQIGDYDVSNFDDSATGIVDLDAVTGNTGFQAVDTHVIGSLDREIVTPSGFVAVSNAAPSRMYEFICDNGTSSPFTQQGLNNTSVFETTDISADVGNPGDIIQDLFQDKVAVLDLATANVFEFDDISSSTPFNSFDVSAQTSVPRSIAFDKQTNRRFYVGDANGKIYAYDINGFLDSPDFVGSVDFSSEVGFDGNPTIDGLEFGDLGRHMYIASSGQTDLLHYRLGEVTPTYE